MCAGFERPRAESWMLIGPWHNTWFLAEVGPSNCGDQGMLFRHGRISEKVWPEFGLATAPHVDIFSQ